MICCSHLYAGLHIRFDTTHFGLDRSSMASWPRLLMVSWPGVVWQFVEGVFVFVNRFFTIKLSSSSLISTELLSLADQLALRTRAMLQLCFQKTAVVFDFCSVSVFSLTKDILSSKLKFAYPCFIVCVSLFDRVYSFAVRMRFSFAIHFTVEQALVFIQIFLCVCSQNQDLHWICKPLPCCLVSCSNSRLSPFLFGGIRRSPSCYASTWRQPREFFAKARSHLASQVDLSRARPSGSPARCQSEELCDA